MSHTLFFKLNCHTFRWKVHNVFWIWTDIIMLRQLLPHVPGGKVNENYTETMLSNGGTYAPYIAISSSVKYKLNKRVHSVKLYCKSVKYLGMTMLSERNSIQNSHRSGHNLFMWSVQEFLLSFSIIIHQVNILTKTYLLYEQLQDNFTSV